MKTYKLETRITVEWFTIDGKPVNFDAGYWCKDNPGLKRHKEIKVLAVFEAKRLSIAEENASQYGRSQVKNDAEKWLNELGIDPKLKHNGYKIYMVNVDTWRV